MRAPAYRQRGVAALELSLVAVPLLAILIAIAGFGGVFMTQQAVTQAAEESGRVAQQMLLSGADPSLAACGAATQAMQWLVDLGLKPTDCARQLSIGAPQACPYAAGTSILLCREVVFTYPGYREFPLFPVLAPLEDWLRAVMGSGASWTPGNLSARAIVQVGKGT